MMVNNDSICIQPNLSAFHLRAQFLEDVRHVTEAPEWMLNVDARTIKTLHGGTCIQMIMHFKGPYAHQLEVVSYDASCLFLSCSHVLNLF